MSQSVTTIRVCGIPPHVTLTEFNGWFLFAPGFEQAKLGDIRSQNGCQIGWARFENAPSAQASIEFLHGHALVEDMSPAQDCVLQAEWAKNDFRPTTKRAQPTYEYNPMQQAKTPIPIAVRNYGGMANPNAVATQALTTLFIGNLQPSVLEDEITTFCQSYLTGFDRLKFVEAKGGKNAFCLAKFHTTKDAQAALQAIPDYALASNPSELLTASFANNELDQPKGDLVVTGATGSNGWAGHATPPAPHVIKFPTVPGSARNLASIPNGAKQGWKAQNSGVGGWGQHSGSTGGAVSQQSTDNPPCDTLFLGNVSNDAQEDQIIQELSLDPQQGFVRMQLNAQKGMAFLLFDSVESAQANLEYLQGAAMPSFPHQVLTVQFSKNSLGKRSRN